MTHFSTLSFEKITIYCYNINKNECKITFFYKIIWHIANYTLTLQPFLTNNNKQI